MALRHPHTVTVQAPTVAHTQGGIAKTASFGTGVTVKCQMTPLTAKSAYDKVGREIDNAFLLIGKPTDSSRFTVGTKVTWGTKTLKVTAEPEMFQQSLLTDHFSVVLEEYRV
jgi:hypothetical protein